LFSWGGEVDGVEGLREVSLHGWLMEPWEGKDWGFGALTTPIEKTKIHRVCG